MFTAQPNIMYLSGKNSTIMLVLYAISLAHGLVAASCSTRHLVLARPQPELRQSQRTACTGRNRTGFPDMARNCIWICFLSMLQCVIQILTLAFTSVFDVFQILKIHSFVFVFFNYGYIFAQFYPNIVCNYGKSLLEFVNETKNKIMLQ